jgi:hypothetical protein
VGYIWFVKSLLTTATMEKQKHKLIYVKPIIKVDKVKSGLFSVNKAISKDKRRGVEKLN